MGDAIANRGSEGVEFLWQSFKRTKQAYINVGVYVP